jgi:hypothetical protein
MKIHAPDGSIIEVGNKEDLELYKLLTASPDIIDNGHTTSMNKLQYETYSYVVDNDCEEGIAIDALARHFGIKPGAAGQRLQTMARAGHLKRISQGRYRAI